MITNPVPKTERKSVSKLQHLVMYVKDLAPVEAFYQKILRITFSAANDQSTSAAQRLADQSMRFYSFGHYHHDMAFVENKSFDVQTNDMLHVTMALKEGESIAALIATLEAEGIDYRHGRFLQSASPIDGLKAVCFQDPSGRWIEVIGQFKVS